MEAKPVSEQPTRQFEDGRVEWQLVHEGAHERLARLVEAWRLRHTTMDLAHVIGEDPSAEFGRRNRGEDGVADGFRLVGGYGSTEERNAVAVGHGMRRGLNPRVRRVRRLR